VVVALVIDIFNRKEEEVDVQRHRIDLVLSPTVLRTQCSSKATCRFGLQLVAGITPESSRSRRLPSIEQLNVSCTTTAIGVVLRNSRSTARRIHRIDHVGAELEVIRW